MALKTRLELRQQQRLALTPAVQTRLTMLRLSPADLDEEIAREAASNPFLLFERGAAAPEARPPVEDVVAAPAVGFQESLRRQLAAMDLAPGSAALADLLVGELRDDGYLDCDLPTLAAEFDLPLAALETALGLVQMCEPAGVGARNLPECLALQLVDKGLPRAQAEATIAQLGAFARRDWQAAADALGLDPAGAQARAALLRRLVPHPVVAQADRQAEYLRADLRLARHSDGTLAVVIDGAARPNVRIDESMARRAVDQGFAPELLIRARAVIAALDQRGQTLQRIGDWLVETQTGFFSAGLEALVPASRSGLAQDLGLHPSTVSRAVAGKAIDVDGRLWLLSTFFSASVPGPDGPVAARAVQRRIAQLIADEPPGRPRSDAALVDMLRVEGVDIARRTVAKYRQGLRIPPSSQRRGSGE